MAHEFNNLLQAIVGSLDVIKHEVQDRDRAKAIIELAQRSAYPESQLGVQDLLESGVRLLVKPIQIDALTWEITRVLGERERR